MVVKDAMDMSQWTDVGWQTYSADQPFSNLNPITHGACTATAGASPSTETGSACFKGTKAAGDGNVFILDSPIPTISADLHKSGTHFPINASLYTTVAVRMRLDTGGQCPVLTGANIPICTGGFIWWPNGLYATPSGQTSSAAFFIREGWGIYFLNIPNIGVGAGTTPWSGIIKALRLNLAGNVGANIEIDWIRLVPAGTSRTINWAGFGSNVDLYLDNNNTQADGNLGIIGKDATLRSFDVGGSSFTFDPAGLAPGTYFVQACATGTSPTSSLTCRHSSSFVVNEIPQLTFTSPSPEGSSDDFATTVLLNPWDMNATTDIDYYLNNTPSAPAQNQGLTPVAIPAVDEAGTDLGNVNVLISDGSFQGDPYMYPLWYENTPPGRGRVNKIDANKYHILTIEAGIPNKARDINSGSIARILWQVQGERNSGSFPRENVSQDIILNHRAGSNVIAKITADMKTLPLEDPTAVTSTTGWLGNIESFRFDAHEFSSVSPVPAPSVQYYVRRIKLAANEQTTGTYNVQWTYTDFVGQTAPTLALYYDTDTDPTAKTLIVSGLNPTAGSYAWNTAAGVPNGTYFIYAEYSDGLNTNGTYARWPIVVGPVTSLTAAPSPTNIIATKSGPTLVFKSPPQEIVVNMTNASVPWTATSPAPWLQINGGSGTGSGRFTVEAINPGDVIGNSPNLTTTVTVSAPPIGTFPVTVTLRIKAPGTSDLPHGSFDTPLSSPTPLSGSFGVTGWALDDIGIDRVEIWRDRAPGETTPVYPGPGPGTGKIFIANAFFVTGARPDVAAAFSDHPFHNRAGWGYLLLSYGLHNQGNGSFTLYAFAYDVEGRSVTLGTKSIVSSNATATKPFGSIDTPGYGETVSGASYVNFGWALTPVAPPCNVAGGSVSVAIDSGPLLPVDYGHNRPDIASAFPGYADSEAAIGVTVIDTTTLLNGSHQIGWYAVDSCGRAEGVGSRFFQVLNGGSSLTSEIVARAAAAMTEVSYRETVSEMEWAPAKVQRHDRDWETAAPNSSGVRVISAAQGERIEVQLPQLEGATFEGASLSANGRDALPAGSSLDAKKGVFYWEPMTGFLGGFDLEFVAKRPGAHRKSLVRVVVGPPVRSSLDLPWAGATEQQPFWVSGWAADLAANEGTGIAAVHAWAFPTTGQAPVYLGAALLGDVRTDVASIYGGQFGPSAYNVLVKGLKPGFYDIAVYPLRAATGTFEGAHAVRVRVQ